jgi:hypothetical protein
MIQVAHFQQGGFVLHRVFVGNSKYSAWYDREGRLLDAERIQGARTWNVPLRHIHVREELARIGQRYKSIPGSVHHLTSDPRSPTPLADATS